MASTTAPTSLPRSDFKDFSYGRSIDLDEYVCVQVLNLAGRLPRSDSTSSIQFESRDYRIVVGLLSHGHPLSCGQSTSHVSFSGHQYQWNQWLSFPLCYEELPLSSVLQCTLVGVDANGRLYDVASAFFHVFGHDGQLVKGRHRLKMESSMDANFGPSDIVSMSDVDVGRLEMLVNRYDIGEIPKVDWLDAITLPEIEKKRKEFLESSEDLYLYISLPDINVPVYFAEPVYRELESGADAVVYDPEMFLDNPVEIKHRRLVRGHRAGPFDRELKPNPKIRDDLQKICSYPPSQILSSEESDMLWKYRYYLTRERQALTKFLKCVDWKDANETRQALELLPIWTEIEADESLELLGPTFENPAVRQYAMRALEKAQDEDLSLYLLQLVEAIKFEGIKERGAYESFLVEFLVRRSLSNPILGNDLHWYLVTECEDRKYSQIFSKVSYHYTTRMLQVPDGYLRRDIYRRQADLVEKITKICRELRASKESRPKRIQKLQAFITDSNNGLNSFHPIPIPLDAQIEVKGIVAETATMFKSNLMPLKLTFRTTSDSNYRVIFKYGDDLRQDQLVMQVIQLMDKLLRKENLDLKLTPYRILATGTKHGMVEFIESMALAAIMRNYNGNIQTYLRNNNPQNASSESYGIDPSVMDTYIRSCAGYCVITYLLGIGDRHLDNLLLTPQGNLFHIDFGYILGRDPKPFPPPMKLCREMVDAMGGASSAHFQKFKSLCYSAFMILRKSSNLILNLVALMVDANIPDIQLEPDKAVLKVQEKFRLDLVDEEAIQYFQTLINDSVTALFPQLWETVHKWAQYWKR